MIPKTRPNKIRLPHSAVHLAGLAPVSFSSQSQSLLCSVASPMPLGTRETWLQQFSVSASSFTAFSWRGGYYRSREPRAIAGRVSSRPRSVIRPAGIAAFFGPVSVSRALASFAPAPPNHSTLSSSSSRAFSLLLAPSATGFADAQFPMTATPNHALQRTAPRVTLAAAHRPAACAHPAPAMSPQPARRAPQSLSLGSLGVATRTL